MTMDSLTVPKGSPATPSNNLDRAIVHFAPDKKRLLAVLLVALCISAFTYALLLRLSYAQIEYGIRQADVVENTLSKIPQYPGPETTMPTSQQGAKLDAASAYQVLRSWGVFGRNVELSQLLKGDTAVVEENVILRALISCTGKTDSDRTDQLGPSLRMLRCVVQAFGGGIATGTNENCLWAEVLRALVGYPGSIQELARKTEERLAANSEDKGMACNLPNDQITAKYIADWFGSNRDETSIVRSMLLTTRLISYPSPAVEAPRAPTSKVPQWSLFDPLKLRFFEEAISRVQSDENVKDARKWLVLWRGPEQFFLLFTASALLLLIGDRLRRRMKVKNEANVVLAWLHNRLDGLQSLPQSERSEAAKALADEIAGQSPKIADGADGSEIKRVNKVNDESVVFYMAEKAVRRIVIEPSNPDLFRQTCSTINAEVERSGWVLRYASRALPAIGFIGTVRGIMLALPAAQNLFGTSGPAQIAALSGVIEPLGLAFATTLIALLAGLITGLVGDWEVAQEQLLLSRIEETLIDRIDPAEV